MFNSQMIKDVTDRHTDTAFYMYIVKDIYKKP